MTKQHDKQLSKLFRLSSIINKIPTIWKSIALFLFLLFSFTLILYIFSVDTGLIPSLHNNHAIQVQRMELKNISMKTFGLTLALLSIVSLVQFIFAKSMINQMNYCLKEALSERKLDSSLTHYYKGKTISQLLKNVIGLFSLFKNFDNMKARQISLESNSIKLLINHIDEGIIIVSNEKIVTHVNHNSEHMLRLISGEIIGQTISRKISDECLLKNLDLVFEKNQKISDVAIQIREGHPLIMNIYPIKNKFGENMRAMIILRPDKG